MCGKLQLNYDLRVRLRPRYFLRLRVEDKALYLFKAVCDIKDAKL